MDVDIPVVEDAVVDVQRIAVGFDILQGDDGTLLHHVAEITRQRELAALAFGQ